MRLNKAAGPTQRRTRTCSAAVSEGRPSSESAPPCASTSRWLAPTARWAADRKDTRADARDRASLCTVCALTCSLLSPDAHAARDSRSASSTAPRSRSESTMHCPRKAPAVSAASSIEMAITNGRDRFPAPHLHVAGGACQRGATLLAHPLASGATPAATIQRPRTPSPRSRVQRATAASCQRAVRCPMPLPTPTPSPQSMFVPHGSCPRRLRTPPFCLVQAPAGAG